MTRWRSWTRSSWADAAYGVAFAAYLTGLLLWLALGLVPPVVSTVGPFRHAFEFLAGGTGPLATPATQVLDHLPSLPQGLWVAMQYLFSGLNLGLGVLLAVRRPRDPVPRLLSLAFIGTAATFNEPSHTVFHILGHAPLVTGVHFTFHVMSGVAYLWAVLLFPDGRLPASGAVARRRLRVAAVLATVVIAWICWQSSFIAHPPFFVAFFGVLVPIVGIAAQTARLERRGQEPHLRQQSRLLRLALAPALAAAAVWVVLRMGELAMGRTDGGAAAAVESIFPVLFAVVPVVLFVAILRYRLWDIDVVMSRTVLVVLLASFVTVVYLAVVAATGWLFRDRGWSAAIAMAVVALAVEPVRQACRRLANRLVFGQELTPREAMRSLADRLMRPTSTDELAELTQVVVAGTRCTSAAVWLVLDDRLLLAARSPAPPVNAERRMPLPEATLDACRAALPDARCVPVTHDGRLLAVLAVTIPAGVALPAAETRLIGDLAGHAGLLVANARLTGSLADQVALVAARAQELRASRDHVVMAQDAERRRLERDIHDGAQQELVALLIQLGMLQRAAGAGVPAPREQVNDLRESLAAARTTLRRLATGQAPESLAQAGIGPALEAAVRPVRRSGLAVTVDFPPHRFPMEIETAIYFCCVEAVQNAAKHAHARSVDVTVQPDATGVAFSVTDDGVGFSPDIAGSGSGLGNFAARLAVLGGTAEVRSMPGAGTRVLCWLPLGREAVMRATVATTPLPAEATP